MKLKNPLAFVLPMFLGAALAVAVGACAEDAKSTQDTEDMKVKQPATAQDTPSMQLHSIMTRGQGMSMPMSGNVDKDFASMMSMHHQMAIDMSDVLLEHGSSAELKALAAKMKAAQQAEIKQMAPYTK